MLNGTDFYMKICGSRKNQIEFVKRLEENQPGTWYQVEEIGNDWMTLNGHTETRKNRMFIPKTFYYTLYNTGLLHLRVEIFAKNCAAEVQEHYILDNALDLVQQEIKWTRLFWDRENNPDFDMFVREIIENHDNDYETYDFLSNLGIKKEDFDEDGFAEYGGFGPWKFTI